MTREVVQHQHTNKSLFFWKPDQKHGYLCQWYASGIIDEHGQRFTCAEQYMMYHKAKHFADTDTIAAILSELDPRKQKALGRQVKDFQPEAWDKVKFDVVKRGNLLKFRQNEGLRELLLATDYRELVEASRFDGVWGIGLTAERARTVPRERWGMNLLGRALMSVRDELVRDSEHAQL